MITLTGSRTKTTYNTLRVNGDYIASWWGNITEVKLEGHIGKLFVAINGSDGFVHQVDEVVFSYPEDWLTSVATVVTVRKGR